MWDINNNDKFIKYYRSDLCFHMCGHTGWYWQCDHIVFIHQVHPFPHWAAAGRNGSLGTTQRLGRFEHMSLHRRRRRLGGKWTQTNFPCAWWSLRLIQTQDWRDGRDTKFPYRLPSGLGTWRTQFLGKSGNDFSRTLTPSNLPEWHQIYLIITGPL